MSLVQSQDRLKLPVTLECQLHDFRRSVWKIKMAEAVGVCIFSVIAAFLFVFALDRVWDTPAGLRIAVFLATWCGCAILPIYLYRWIWRQRRLEQLARLLSRRLPRVGDQLLGIIELVRSETEQARSRSLCEAAVRQVALDAEHRNLCDATPKSRHRMWSGLAVASIVTATTLLMFFPAATVNAWARFLAPWTTTPRYTFAAVEALPEQLIVPHGEPFTVTVRLQKESVWRPPQAEVQLGKQQPIQAKLQDGRYAFHLPPQIDTARLRVRIGDSEQLVQIEPTLRPELKSVVARVSLPEYLGLPHPFQKDVRSGAISLVKGSRAAFSATATRPLATAQIDRQPQTPAGATISSFPMIVNGSTSIEFRWQDDFGLEGKQPFTLRINGRDDEPPSLACEDLPRQKVVLDSEQLAFRVRARDDFGIKQIGLEWQGFDHAIAAEPAEGERILSAGGNDKADLDIGGTFCAQSLEIEPQPIRLRIFAEDYFPGRERVYSPTYVLYVLNAEQHAIWMTEQLNKWHRQSLEIRDREMQLYETNKQLRDLSADELDRPETRRRIENQAAAERANGRRLSNLTARGEGLLRQASRNPEFGVGHLEQWAEMLQILKDISANRMPSVADLLKEAALARSVADASPGKQAPKVGQVRASGSGTLSDSDKNEKKPSAIPQIADVESTQQPADEKSKPQPPKNSSSPPGLGLPTTTLIGSGAANDSCPTGWKMEEAVEQQRDLLAEFERIANELNTLLANLEGSTLVKRLKAASRQQYRIAGRIGDQLSDVFGLRPSQIHSEQKDVLWDLAKAEDKSSLNVSRIMDDMQSYFERRRFVQFRTVLDDMKEQDVIGGLRQLDVDIPKESGLSIAQCEFWSDSLDRWAEDLVDPASGGT